MREYQDKSRGTFQNIDYAKQLVSFDGMRFEGRSGLMNVTPTDIDGCIQLDREKLFIFFELKHSGGIPNGQSDALTRLCDTVQKTDVGCIIILAIHNTPYPETIEAKDAIATRVYTRGIWRVFEKPKPLLETINWLIEVRRRQLNKRR